MFLSFNAPNQNKGTKQTITESSVAQRIQEGYFDKVGDKKLSKPGSIAVWIKDADGQVRRIGDEKNPVKTSVEELTKIFQQMEEMIQGSTPEQFFKQLEEKFGDTIDFKFNPHPGVTYTAEEMRAHARNVIANYIRNRNFGRLDRPSNILDALNQGSDHPGNTEIKDERFHGVAGKVINSNINDVSSLHIHSVDGVYYYDLAAYASESQTFTETDDQGNTSNAITELEIRKKAYDDAKEKLLNPLRDALSEYYNAKGSKRSNAFDALVNMLDYDLLRGYKASEGKFDENGIFILSMTGKNVNRIKSADAIYSYLDELAEEINAGSNAIAEQLAQELVENAEKEEKEQFIENGKHARVQFAVGSFDEGNGKATVLRSDGSGAYLPMVGVKGKPGAVYLIIPSWMTGSGKQRIVHLNNRKLAIHQATFIAKLLDSVRTGKLSYTGDITDPNVIDGFKISTKYTVKQILEELINIGTKQAEYANDAATFAKLLFVDNQGNVHFGDKILDDTNLSELISFIQDKKPMRVDRQRLLNEDSKVGISLNVELVDNSEFLTSGVTTDKNVFDINENENYQHYVISKGVVRTTLNADKGARLFNNVVTAIKLPGTGNQTIPNPASKHTQGSPAQEKEEAFTSKDDFVEQVNASETPASTGKVKVTGKDVLTEVNKVVTEPGRYWVSIKTGSKETPLKDAEDNPLRIGQVGETLTSIDLDDVANTITKRLNTPKKDGSLRPKVRIVLTDEKDVKHEITIKRPASSTAVNQETSQPVGQNIVGDFVN